MENYLALYNDIAEQIRSSELVAIKVISKYNLISFYTQNSDGYINIQPYSTAKYLPEEVYTAINLIRNIPNKKSVIIMGDEKIIYDTNIERIGYDVYMIKCRHFKNGNLDINGFLDELHQKYPKVSEGVSIIRDKNGKYNYYVTDKKFELILSIMLKWDSVTIN